MVVFKSLDIFYYTWDGLARIKRRIRYICLSPCHSFEASPVIILNSEVFSNAFFFIFQRNLFFLYFSDKEDSFCLELDINMECNEMEDSFHTQTGSYIFLIIYYHMSI